MFWRYACNIVSRFGMMVEVRGRIVVMILRWLKRNQLLRRTDQSTSGRSSSHLTAPPVTRSMSGHRSAGVELLFHLLTACGETPMSFANAVCPPHAFDAFSTGFMSQIKPQVEFKINLKCVEPSGSRGYSLRMETRSVQRQIKDALKEKKLTQSKLAELCKVSDNAVSKWVLRPFSRSSRTRTSIRSSAGGTKPPPCNPPAERPTRRCNCH